VDGEKAMNEQDLKHTLEATLLAAGRPVTTQQLLDLFDERERPTPEQLESSLALLKADYETRGIELIQVASGWRIQVRSRCVDVVSRLWQERPSRYSRALLETLALIAYRQPITRSEIEEIRGVSISSTIMRTMQERNWIRVVGHREVPGRPELLGTTREFLDYFGLKSLDQLPTLADLRDVENIGVQLELPDGDATQSAAEVAAEGAESDVAENGETAITDEAELSADADEGEEVAQEDGSEDSDSSTLVASAESESDDNRTVREPPLE
jgi:segregation and condensation protein B